MERTSTLVVQKLKLQWRGGKKAFKLQEALDRDSTVTEFIKETDKCAISVFSESSSMQIGSRGGALKPIKKSTHIRSKPQGRA